jgi:hypothetical protein
VQVYKAGRRGFTEHDKELQTEREEGRGVMYVAFAIVPDLLELRAADLVGSSTIAALKDNAYLAKLLLE